MLQRAMIRRCKNKDEERESLGRATLRNPSLMIKAGPHHSYMDPYMDPCKNLDQSFSFNCRMDESCSNRVSTSRSSCRKSCCALSSSTCTRAFLRKRRMCGSCARPGRAASSNRQVRIIASWLLFRLPTLTDSLLQSLLLLVCYFRYPSRSINGGGVTTNRDGRSQKRVNPQD